jgi:hypothetical protein
MARRKRIPPIQRCRGCRLERLPEETVRGGRGLQESAWSRGLCPACLDLDRQERARRPDIPCGCPSNNETEDRPPHPLRAPPHLSPAVGSASPGSSPCVEYPGASFTRDDNGDGRDGATTALEKVGSAGLANYAPLPASRQVRPRAKRSMTDSRVWRAAVKCAKRLARLAE